MVVRFGTLVTISLVILSGEREGIPIRQVVQLLAGG